MRFWAFLLLSAVTVAAQSSYSTSHAWWEPNQDEMFPWDSEYENPSGQLRISNAKGSFRTGTHPFFKPLGTNGRACVTCHQPSNAMSLSVVNIRTRWDETNGKDPLFAAIDGSNCPSLPQAERSSHSLLLDRGLIRVALAWPPKSVRPDFRIDVVSDPTGCNQNPGEISVYRRPRMSANLTKLIPGPNGGAVLMADGRAPSLRDQAIDAVLVHEQATTPPEGDMLRLILDFETQVTASQHSDLRGGLLSDLKIQASGIQGEFRNSVTRGKAVFASRCASCHEPGTQRWHVVAPKHHTPDLPLFRITCDSGGVVMTQDPGRALVSGKCADVGAIVVPQFHGLAARAPYFSDGSAATLDQLVDSYRDRLNIHFNPSEKRDLVNFLLSF